MTPRGFGRLRVETLQAYARLFDVSVADFFQFTHLDGDLDVEVDHSDGGLVQRLRIFARESGAGPTPTG